jgi:hypothetical protein
LLAKWLRTLHVLGLPALRAFDHVKLHLLTLLQAAEAARLNGREVHKYILAVLAADETVAFGVIKALSLFLFPWCCIVPFSFDVALNFGRFLLQAGHALVGGASGCCGRTLKVKTQ